MKPMISRLCGAAWIFIKLEYVGMLKGLSIISHGFNLLLLLHKIFRNVKRQSRAVFRPLLLCFSSSLSYPACMPAAVSSFPWLRMRSCRGGGRHAGNTCWVPCLRFSPCFHLSTSPSPPLFWICHCLFFHLYLFLPSTRPPPSLHLCFPASRLCPLTGATGVKLSKHSLWCWSALHTVMYRLCNTQDEGRMTLLGCHVLPEDIQFTLFISTGNRHLHHASNPNKSSQIPATKYKIYTRDCYAKDAVYKVTSL